MVDFAALQQELQQIDFNDINSWPVWFRWVGIGVVSVGLLLAGYQFFVGPERSQLTAMERQEQELRQSFLNKKRLSINLPAYRAQMQEIEDRFGVVLQLLPDRTEVPALLIDISQAGLSRG